MTGTDPLFVRNYATQRLARVDDTANGHTVNGFIAGGSAVLVAVVKTGAWFRTGGRLSRYTRQATMEELASIKRLYEMIYGCNLVIMRRMPARRF